MHRRKGPSPGSSTSPQQGISGPSTANKRPRVAAEMASVVSTVAFFIFVFATVIATDPPTATPASNETTHPPTTNATEPYCPPTEEETKRAAQECTNGTVMNTLFLPFIPGEKDWVIGVRAAIYILLLCYFFLGVAIASDIFMSAIEYIVSKSKTVPFEINAGRRGSDPDVAPKVTIKVDVRVWNPTVANLTLMALGSSAPEILLSVIESCRNEFESNPTDLGAGTIVGSAAFNLLFISAVCVMYVKKGETRRIKVYNVFIITTVFSLFAYIWLWIVLDGISPGVVQLWEALVTLLCFPVLVLIAWWADNKFCFNPKKNVRQSFMVRAEEIQEELHIGGVDTTPAFMKDDNANPLYAMDGSINQAALLKFYKEIRENAELSDEEAAQLVAFKLVQSRRHDRLWYRMGACRALMGNAKLQPTLNEKLKEVYKVINEFERRDHKDHKLTIKEISPDVLHKNAVFDFQVASYSVPESIGTLNIVVTRTGRSDNDVAIRVTSVDGSAKEGKDYVRVDAIAKFEPFVTDRTIPVKIIDDNQWEPDSYFFLRLSLVDAARDDVVIGQIHTMEITIVDDDKPGVISLTRRGLLVSETSREVEIEVIRTDGADGKVTVAWKTIPDSHGPVHHPHGLVGKLVFNHGETNKHIHVPLYHDNSQDKDSETFDVELTAVEGGAKLGKLKKTSVTVSDDVAFQETVNKVVELAAQEMEVLEGSNDTIVSQLKNAFVVSDEDDPSCIDYTLHFFTLPWKVLLALIPPPRYLGGWLCFIVSLIVIGLLTAAIGDVATIVGCIINLKPTITAITFVALGTSLPDTFASMSAARHDDSADNSIGNVTGSNSVNVFLGLGLPWTMGAIFHLVKTKEDGLYKVESGSLGFSVIIFSAVALLAIGVLVARRFIPIFGNAELGGPVCMKILSGMVLLLLWLIYILLSGLEAYKYIDGNILGKPDPYAHCKKK